MVSLKNYQIIVGFDVPIYPEEVARVLAVYFGRVVVGKGLPQNGLPPGYLHVLNTKDGLVDV